MTERLFSARRGLTPEKLESRLDGVESGLRWRDGIDPNDQS